MSPNVNNITVITATYNAASKLPQLIESLKNQTDKYFTWIVADGYSTDDTVSLLMTQIPNFQRLEIRSDRDRGIYDAINKAIIASNTEFYLVIGSDDYLAPNAIENFKKIINNFEDVDLISASVVINGLMVSNAKPSWVWLHGSRARISSHSVGSCIRKSLHDKYGYYSDKFPIYADGFFLLQLVKGGAKIFNANFVSGEFAAHGFSNQNRLRSFAEQLDAQLITGGGLLVQLLLFNVRVMKLRLKEFFKLI